MSTPDTNDCIVIGAGPAGLAMSEALAARAISHRLLERGQVGHSWRTQRWAGLRLNSPGWLNRSLHGEGDDYPTAGWAVERMAQIAHRLPVETGVPVLQLSRADGGFRLVTPGGRHRARTVVVATGDANVPHVPRLAAALPARLSQRHSAYYTSPDDLPPGAVLVVGSGQSGAQIADELLDAGRTVILATSPVGRVPLWRRGHDAVRILVDVGFFDMPTADLPDPAMARAPQPLLAPGRNLSLGRLEVKGAVLAGRLAGVQGETVTFAGSALAHAATGEGLAYKLNEVVDGHLAARGALDPIAPEEVEPLPTAAEPSAVDLARSGVNSVIWCTGYTGDFRWIEPGLLDDHGRPRRIGAAATDAPGLFYLGLRWLTRRGSGIFYGFGQDAERIADAIEATLGLAGEVGALSRLGR